MRKIFILKHQYESDYTYANIWANELCNGFGHGLDNIDAANYNHKSSAFALFLEEQDASMLVIENHYQKKTQYFLNLCRDLRIPYLFLTKKTNFELKNICIPITFLIEDREKIPFSSSFGRFFGSNITIYKPKDYGSKATENIGAAITLFDSLSLNHSVCQAKKGSFAVEKEAVKKAKENGHNMVIISASREYGLDDIVFGPKERAILNIAQVPILVINPRDDLYALCD